MRIPIREQLALLVLFTALTALAVLALATWFQNRNFVISIRLTGLSLTASLKAAQLASTLLLYQSQVRSVATRLIIQSALQRYNNGNDTNENWSRSQSDLAGALANGDLLVQARIFPAYSNGNRSAEAGLVSATSDALRGRVQLPYPTPDGSAVFLGDPGPGYPPALYPNLTYHNATGARPAYASVDDRTLNQTGTLFLGPLLVNQSYALLSATMAITNNTTTAELLGWLTVLIDVSLLFDVRNSEEGLGDTGEVLIVGPDTADNQFAPDESGVNLTSVVEGAHVRFVLPPLSDATTGERHAVRGHWQNFSEPFPIASFPAAEYAWTRRNRATNNAGALIKTHNEQGERVSMGYARCAAPFVDWALLVEQSYSEVTQPINHLRNIVLICVFSVVGVLFLLALPLAHYSVAPIRQLGAATRKTVEPYQPDDQQSGYSGSSLNVTTVEDVTGPEDEDEARKEGFMAALARWKQGEKQEPGTGPRRRRRKRTFRIPSKVPERRHLITDELTDLTGTFNEMSDELAMQYERLEERVKERTAELESSKKAAEAANQSKTLFIANISHELKTPLNGILGLTSVCMNEIDPAKIRSTLKTIYQSGDLLLHLLTDLLTFSKNEVGQQLSIDEAEFRLHDLNTQLMATFERQARDAQIDLQVRYYGTNDTLGNTDSEDDKLWGPAGTGRVRDMCVYGDKNRILQVLMNFVSNSLKFTPPQGAVTVRIKCTGVLEPGPTRAGSTGRKSSLNSRRSRTSSKKKVRTSEPPSVLGESDDDRERRGPAPDRANEESKLSINLMGGVAQIAKIAERQRSMSPAPVNTKDLMFELEVEDTGPGIPDDQQLKIFEPFVQGDLGLSRKYGGTGLGLSICAQLASLMGGNISLTSTVGEGSTFAMRLPLRYLSERSASISSSVRPSHSKSSSVVGQTVATDADQSPRGAKPPAVDDVGVAAAKLPDVPRIVGFTQPYVAKEVTPSPSAQNLDLMKQAETEAAIAGRKVRVLVAEDNKINQEVVLRMLKLEDVYDVTIAKDGQEAVDKVKECMDNGQRFHLVFMDVQMPNVDGIQSTRMIRGMGFSAPIIALTAFAEKSNEDECMASGMDFFLAKPIRRPALKQVLKKYCATIPEEDGNGPSPGSSVTVTDAAVPKRSSTPTGHAAVVTRA